MTGEQRFAELRTRLGEIHDLRKAAQFLQWDHETFMPPAGAGARGEQLGTVARLAHERFVSDDLGLLLDDLRSFEESLPYESDEASLVRVARRDYERARRIPAELHGEIARAGTHGVQAWLRARENNDYAVFRPALERNLELQARYIACFDGATDPYDLLLAEYEPGVTAADVEAVFDRLKTELAPIVATLPPAEDAPAELRPGRDPHHGAAPVVFAALGFDPEWGRVDRSEHPFAASLGTGDIRLTTRDEGELAALHTALHEFGHGIYERGVDPSLERTLLAEGASAALHESQSRLWENLVGRGRPFCSWVARALDADIDASSLHREANRIRPSLIRVDADEVTYNLHVIFRFELERELVAGRLAAAELPDAWNDKVRRYLGLDVPDDLRGVLQDIHWSGGLMGYFPTYALGNVIAVQIWERARADLPDLDEQIEQGEFDLLSDWLRERVHRHGRKFTPAELLERVIGGPLEPEPLLRHLRAKLDGLA